MRSLGRIFIFFFIFCFTADHLLGKGEACNEAIRALRDSVARFGSLYSHSKDIAIKYLSIARAVFPDGSSLSFVGDIKKAKWVKSRAGRYGWEDGKGRIWIPCMKDMNCHGGPHFDVQLKDGSHVNAMIDPQRGLQLHGVQ